MTVIAALRIEGIPAAIGDFITTDDQKGVKHSFVPTRPAINDAEHMALPRRIHGFRRKLHLINPRFIVAFTGFLKEAADVLAELQRQFGQSDNGPTLHELDRVLEPFNDRCEGKLTVIGWTVQSRPRCFKWVAASNARVAHVTHAIEGSGAKHFGGLLTDAQSAGYSTAVRVAQDKATLMGIAKVGAVLADELLRGGTLQHSYGYGAELALFNGREFQFVPGLAYWFCAVRIELDGSITYMPANIVAAYEPRGRFCAMEVTRLAMGDDRLNATDTYLAAISPPHDSLFDVQQNELRRVVDLSQVQFYFIGLAFFDTRTNASGTIRASAQKSDDDFFFRVHKQDGQVRFEWKRSELEAMILEAAHRAAASLIG
jgi:hypothetical protein